MSSRENLLMGRYNQAELILLKTITPLHPGTGRAGGIVDLPIQRDAIGFPTIYASSLKGSMKSSLALSGKEAEAKKFFGSEPGEETQMGEVEVLDALLVCIPARSYRGVYAYVTCPYLLNKLLSYLELVSSLSSNDKVENLKKTVKQCLEKSKDLGEEEALASRQASEKLTVKLGEGKEGVIVLNEEFFLKPKTQEAGDKNGDLVTQLAQQIKLGDDSWRLLIVPDEATREIVERSLIRHTRIRLERSRKKVERGGLWTEEYIPVSTVFATALIASKEADNIVGKLLENLGDYIIIGGKESIGKGIVKIERIGEKNEGS